MQHNIVDRVGITDQQRLDEWFDLAMNDPTVMPFLGLSTHRPRLIVPDDDYDGVVLMDRTNHGVLKLYFDHDCRTVKFGIWVMLPTDGSATRGEIATSLFRTAFVILKYHPNIVWMASRVMVNNIHGMNFSRKLFGNPWGIEPDGGFYKGWNDVAHFRGKVTEVETGFKKWYD